MLRTIKYFLIASLTTSGLMAMEEEQKEDQVVGDADFVPADHICARADWSTREPNPEGLKQHTHYGQENNLAQRILVGCTVTPLADASSINYLHAVQAFHMNSKKFADIAYNCCLDYAGERFDCRPFEIVPSLYQGNNIGTCAIGILGTEIQEVGDSQVKMWGLHFGQIAREIGFEKLEHKVNFFIMSDMPQGRFPKNPGVNFSARLDEMLKIANDYLQNR